MFCITAAELKKMREKLKLSQEQVVIGAGIAQSTISRFECGTGSLQMLEILTDTVEKHVAGVHIPAEKLAMLFSRDMTRTEIEAVVDNASIKLAQETGFTIRDMLEEGTKSLTQ